MKEPVTLKLTAAVVLGGNIHRAGSLVEVEDALARNLLDRGKAELATEKNAGKQPKRAESSEADDAEAKERAETDAAVARVMKDEELDEAAFLALSGPKRTALVKSAKAAIAKEAEAAQ